MLFGVNAFCLDSSGALWLTSPHIRRGCCPCTIRNGPRGRAGYRHHRHGGWGRMGGGCRWPDSVLSTLRRHLGRGMGHSHLHATVHQPAAPSRPAWAAGHPRPAWCDGGLFRPPRRWYHLPWPRVRPHRPPRRPGAPAHPHDGDPAAVRPLADQVGPDGRTPGSGPAWWRRSAAASHPVLGKRETGLRAKGTVLVIG